jgi:hypothetical protein
MVAPPFVISLLWDRLDWRPSRLFRPRSLTWALGPPRRTITGIVDRALALSGGAGYAGGSPLARAYRDVKPGSFMHPLGANRAYDYLADGALGEATSLH